jgi:hypothetical protein
VSSNPTWTRVTIKRIGSSYVVLKEAGDNSDELAHNATSTAPQLEPAVAQAAFFLAQAGKGLRREDA